MGSNSRIPRAGLSAACMALCLVFLAGGCMRYGFTGTSIPEEVNTVFIPFFADQSSSNLGDLSDRLNGSLVNRFINQTRLSLANSRETADAVLEGSIVTYTNRPFSITGEEQTDQNEIVITVRATFQYTGREEPEFSKTFSGRATYDPNENPIEGESTAADEALEQLSSNIFNDAVSGW